MENQIFKYYYLQNPEFTRYMDPAEMDKELASINFDRARNPDVKNKILLKSSLD